MKQYLNLLNTIYTNGRPKGQSREGLPETKSIFGYQMRFNLQDGFPLLTTKEMFPRSLVSELLWFLTGNINIKYLLDNKNNFWNQDAYNYYDKVKNFYPSLPNYNYEEFIAKVQLGDGPGYRPNKAMTSKIAVYHLGDCGFQYGKTWRNFTDVYSSILEDEVRVDQILEVLRSLKSNPEGRRHLVTAINPEKDKDLALYWCHSMFQFNCRKLSQDERVEFFKKNCIGGEDIREYCVRSNIETDRDMHLELESFNIPEYYLDCHMYQRSADIFLGVPYNIASYALLTHIFAYMLNYIPGDFIHSFGDAHIYDNHLEQAKLQLTREPMKLPTVKLSNTFDCDLDKVLLDSHTLTRYFNSLNWDDIYFEDYKYHPAIKAPLSTGLIR